MSEFEPDLVELEDNDGGKVTLRVERYFFYNGDEYVLLTDDLEDKGDPDASRYVMKVEPLPGEGEDMEEFVPVADELMDRLIRAAQITFRREDEEEDE